MFDVSAILAQHAGNLETFHTQKQAEEHAGFLAAQGVPCLIRKVDQPRDPDAAPTGTIVCGGRAALAETVRRARRGEIPVQPWMLKEAPGLGLYAGRWLA